MASRETMNKKKLVDLIQETILAKHIRQADLCSGLCSVSALSKFLNRERRMDRLLLSALLQRLGLSSDHFITLLSEEEYLYFDWRQRLASAELVRDWKQAKLILEESVGRNYICNQPLQEQFYLLMQGRIQEKLSGDKRQGLPLYERAIQMTMPDFPQCINQHTLLSVQEISVILLWQDRQPDKELSAVILRFLENYVSAHFAEEREVVKLYPKIAAGYLPLLFQQEKYYECLVISEKAMDMMIESSYASSMEAVLEYYIQASEKLNMGEQIQKKKVQKKKVQLAAWRELMQEIGHTEDSLDDELFLMDVWQEIDLLDEVMSKNRQYQGYSQEKLSEGICTPESLSRIENAKRMPNAGTFKALAKKLSLREEYYYSTIETDDIALLNQQWQIDKLIMNREWDRVEKENESLSGKLDLSIPCNRQYVEEVRYLSAAAEGRIPSEQHFSELRRILGITLGEVPKNRDIREWPEEFWKRPFQAEEISVMMEMADVFVRDKELEQAEFLLEKLLAHYQSSRVKPEFHFRRVILIIARLSQCTGFMKKHEKELLYSEEGIRLCLVSGTRRQLPSFVNNKADALENLGEKEASLKYYKLAFYIAEVMKKTVTAKVAKGSFEQLAEKQIDWY